MAWRRHMLQERAAGRLQERCKREESLRAAAEAKRQEQETFEVGIECAWGTSVVAACGLEGALHVVMRRIGAVAA